MPGGRGIRRESRLDGRAVVVCEGGHKIDRFERVNQLRWGADSARDTASPDYALTGRRSGVILAERAALANEVDSPDPGNFEGVKRGFGFGERWQLKRVRILAADEFMSRPNLRIATRRTSSQRAASRVSAYCRGLTSL